MVNVLILIFSMTLIYLLSAGRLKTYAQALALQGVLLFGIAFSELRDLKEMHYNNLVFILLETLIFKGIAVPMYIYYLVKKNNIYYEREPNTTNFHSLFKIALVFIFSFIIGYTLHKEGFKDNTESVTGQNGKIIYFTASVSALFTGLLILILRKKIITLIVGYMVLENGIFLLSLAMGNEMPIVVNLGVLFDIITTTFLLGIFLNKVQNVFHDIEIKQLSELKD
jgi:hydrogenase-4 component E